MKQTFFFVLLLSALGFISCKSEFEKIRVSGDTEKIYESALSLYEEGEWQKSQTLLELIIGAYRGRPELEDIYFKYAYTFYNEERYILASYYFNNFANTFTTSVLREDASFMSAYSNYQLSPVYRLDQSYTEKAIDEFQVFVNTYPESPRVEECNKLIDRMRKKLEKKAFETSKLYFELRQYQSATQSFENLLKDYPETNNAEQVRFLIVKSSYLLASNSIVEKQEERFNQTKEYANKFLEKYEKSDYYKEVREILTASTLKLNSFTNGGYQNQSAGTGS